MNFVFFKFHSEWRRHIALPATHPKLSDFFFLTHRTFFIHSIILPFSCILHTNREISFVLRMEDKKLKNENDKKKTKKETWKIKTKKMKQKWRRKSVRHLNIIARNPSNCVYIYIPTRPPPFPHDRALLNNAISFWSRHFFSFFFVVFWKFSRNSKAAATLRKKKKVVETTNFHSPHKVENC